MARTTLAFNSERLRQLLWSRVAPPPEMLQKAVEKLDQQLEATETKFFTMDGLVVSREEVPAHAIQQNAAISILKMSDAFPRDRIDKAGPPSVTLEITKEGVFRIHVGGASSGEEASDAPQPLNGDTTQLNTENAAHYGGSSALGPAVTQFMADHDIVEERDSEPPTQVIRMKDYRNKQEAIRILMSEEDKSS